MHAGDIKMGLKEHNHAAVNVSNMVHRQTRKQLPMFIVELLPTTN